MSIEQHNQESNAEAPQVKIEAEEQVPSLISHAREPENDDGEANTHDYETNNPEEPNKSRESQEHSKEKTPSTNFKPIKPATIAPKPIIENDEEGSQESQNVIKDNKDYSKIFEKYQERFRKVYAISQKLFMTERAQRQTFNHYQRRNNALMDLLNEVEQPNNDQDILSDGDKLRLENLSELNPRLKNTLAPLLAIEDPTKNIKIKNSYKVNMLLHEGVPELISDDLDLVENNPQDSDFWIRRNYPHLVISKYKPIDLKPTGVHEHFEQSQPLKKGKRKPVKEEEVERDVKKMKS